MPPAAPRTTIVDERSLGTIAQRQMRIRDPPRRVDAKLCLLLLVDLAARGVVETDGDRGLESLLRRLADAFDGPPAAGSTEKRPASTPPNVPGNEDARQASLKKLKDRGWNT